jgi:hypothetical protein
MPPIHPRLVLPKSVLNLQMPDLTDNDAINIFTLEDAVYVASETNYLRRVDVETLATQEKVRPIPTLFYITVCSFCDPHLHISLLLVTM